MIVGKHGSLYAGSLPRMTRPEDQQCPWMKKPVSQTGSPQEGTVRTGSDPAARSARHSGQPGRFGQVPAALESALEKRSGASFIAVDHVANAASSRIRAVTQARSSRKLPGPRTGPGASKAPRKRSLLHGSRLSPCRGGENRRGAQRASLHRETVKAIRLRVKKTERRQALWCVGAASPERDFPAPGTAGGRKIVWGGEYLMAAETSGKGAPDPSYAAMVSKSSLALLLAGLAPSTDSRCSRASSLRPR